MKSVRARACLFGRRTAAQLGAAVALACGQGDQLVAPLTGALEVRVVTSGDPSDPDGYTVSLDDDSVVVVASTDTVLWGELAPGEHRLALGDVTAGCEPAGPPPATVRVRAEDTVTVTIELFCTAPASVGTVLVTVVTSGSPPDPDGYSLAADPAAPIPLGDNGTGVVPDLAVGEHLVRLQGVADHCTIAGDALRVLVVPADDTVRTLYQVTCRGPLVGRIVFSRDRNDESGAQDLFMVNADGTGLTNLTSDLTDPFFAEPSFSGDGRRLAAALHESVVLIDLESGAGAPEITPVAEGMCPALSSDGSRMLYRGRLDDGSALPPNAIFLRHLPGSAEDTILVEGDEGIIGCAAWSPDDARIAVPVELFETSSLGIYLVPIAGGSPQLVHLDPDRDFAQHAVSWSPSGDRLAMVIAAREFGAQDVFAVALDGTLTNLTRGRAGFTDSPSWSPDGTRLVFQGEGGIYLINSDGTGLTRLTREPSPFDLTPAWGKE